MPEQPARQPELDDTALDETVADVDLDESLDAGDTPAGQGPGEHDEALGEYDPEAGQTRIADKSGIAAQIMSEAGMFVIGVLVALLGVSVLIYALVLMTPRALITAAVIAPPALFWAFLKWKRWLGGAPYAYRLLMSLNEREAADETLAKHRERQRAQVAKRIAELEKRGIHVEPQPPQD